MFHFSDSFLNKQDIFHQMGVNQELEERLRNYEPKPVLIPVVQELLEQLGFREFSIERASGVIDLGAQYGKDLRVYIKINEQLLIEKSRIKNIDGSPEVTRTRVDIGTRPIPTDEIFAEIVSISPQGNVNYSRFTAGIILQARATNDGKAAANKILNESIKNQQAIDYLLSELSKAEIT